MNTECFEDQAYRNLFGENIVLEVDAIVLVDDIALGFAFMCEACHRCLHNVLLLFRLHDNSILTHLLLDEDDFFGSVDDEVSSGVQWALMQTGHDLFRLAI